ncbi:TonB-dependent hemoglobin/transferrin/lactoferrin family receptor [Devosia nitrariae]|uniref:Ligand-gated channel n=1 Tax=Devosia nitrariae TaxID=2071872 RepID=A0ABQ5W4I4_9HYPH|nr:TonB-dependent hemoglobin/transferrin/lactoferrin family receptor [Devosia nitrariae]GLQ54653.1 ligand-gated channel [Devosia nitrariae]
MGLVGRRAARLLGSVALTIVGLQGAAAQSSDINAGNVTLLERLVIGAGAPKVAIDTPQAVTVVDQDDIDAEQATTVGEVLEAIPGVSVSGSERVFGQTFNIRGIGAPESANEEGRIIVNVDGATKYYEQYRMGGFFSDPELYKQVELLRGPASSTLYGSGAIGGVINFVTKDASDFIAEGMTGALRVKGGYNSNGDGLLGSVILAHRLTGDLDVLLAGNYRRSDDYVTGDGDTVSSSDFDAWSGLAKVTARLDDGGVVRLSYQQWDSDADDQDYARVGTSSIFGTVDRHVVDRTAIISYENPFSDNDWLDFRLSASFSDTSVEQTDASGNPMFGLSCATPGGTTFCDADYGYQTWQIGGENTGEWHGESWDNYLTYGVQFARQTRSAEYTDVLGNTLGLAHHPQGTDTKIGAFVQNEFVWDEKLTLIPGIRFDWRWLNPDDSTGLMQDMDDVAISPKFAALYKLTDAFGVFGSIAYTERLPTLDEIYSTPYPSYGLEKEQATNYEAGFTVSGYDLLQGGDSLQVKTTGFYNDISNLIDRQCSSAAACAAGGFTSQYVNIDEAQIYGIEMELAYDSDYVFATAGYTHIIGENTSTGDYLDTVAPDELALTLGGKLPENGLSVGWRARFVADPQDSADVDETATSGRVSAAFNVHDVFLTWKPETGPLEGTTVNFGIDNVFDTQYKEYLQNDPGKGRTFKLSLAKRFDY